MTTPAPSLHDYLSTAATRPDDVGALAHELEEAGARPRVASGLLAAARRLGLPLNLHRAARVAAEEYGALVAAHDAITAADRATAPNVAVVTRASVSWDGTVHLVQATHLRCGREVLHGAGPASGPLHLGARTPHCPCVDTTQPDYELVLPGTVGDLTTPTPLMAHAA